MASFRPVTNQFVNQMREYLERLRSTEGDDLTEADLHVFRVQLRLLESEVSNRQYKLQRGATDRLPQA
jgi:hypothetical protein